MKQSLVEKYRPSRVEDLVLPIQHGLRPALSFVKSPYASGWLLHGRSGLGKTSLASIMALSAAGHPLSVQRFLGPDLDSAAVKELAVSCSQRPLFGQRHAVVVDEADAIPKGAQVRLLGVLDSLTFSSWIFTSNDDIDSFEPRFLSRVKAQLFSAQGLFAPATTWLLGIAKNEGISLTRPAAEKLVRDGKNNLRGALQLLELMIPFKDMHQELWERQPESQERQQSQILIPQV